MPIKSHSLNAAIQPISGSLFWNETTTPLTSTSTFTGTSRDVGQAAGTATIWSFFNAFFLADQAGTAYIEGSNDGTTWYVITTSALAINVPLSLAVPIMTRYHRAKLVNGSNAQTNLKINTAYTAT